MKWEKSGLESIKGKIFDRIEINDNTITLFYGDKKVQIHATGDCCSESWFYSLRNPGAILKSEVKEFIEIDTSWVNIEDGLGRQDSESVYGIGVVTDKGVFEIVYRNSSNGYYGGNLEIFQGDL